MSTRATPRKAAVQRRSTRTSTALAAVAPTQQDNILQTAAEFFAEQGFAAASTAELAARCGVSKALLFHYYASKEAILFALLDAYTRHLLTIADEARQQTTAGPARLHALIRAFLATYESARARHMVLLNDVKHLPSRERAHILEQERALVTLMAQSLRQAYPSDVKPARAKALAMMLFGMINWTFTWLRPDGRIGYGDFAEAVIAMLERGIPGAARALA